MIQEETVQKIRQVATVCIRCRRCMHECLMLSRFAQNPKALFTQYLEQGPENMDRHIAYSCNECSQCTLKCPKNLNLKAVFQALKADYAQENQGIVPVEALLPSEAGQQKECSPDYCTVLSGGSRISSPKTARYLFVPGKFPPEPIVAHLRQSLGSHNVDLLSKQVLEDITPDILNQISLYPSQVLITACPSGYTRLRETFPERKILFYWDLMHDLIGIPNEIQYSEQSVKLHKNTDPADSIRWVLSRLNCEWTETDSPADLHIADGECRQVLGLLFESEIKKQPYRKDESI